MRISRFVSGKLNRNNVSRCSSVPECYHRGSRRLPEQRPIDPTFWTFLPDGNVKDRSLQGNSEGTDMGIFGSIMDKIFHHKPAVPAPNDSAPAPPRTPATPKGPTPTASPVATPSAKVDPVDVEAVLAEMATMKNGGNWRISIVDLLTLLGLESSLSARKELAEELNVHAGAHGSAEQNIALHKAVMAKLAENGGIVPDSLRS